MKILQVIPYFTQKRGGDVNVCYHLSKSLTKNGHDVTIITTDFEFDEKYAKTLEKYGVKIFAFSCFMNISLFLYSPLMKKWLKSNLSNFEIVHLHDFRTYQNILVTKYAVEKKIPFILQAHGDIPYFEKKWLKYFFDIIWGNAILKNSNLLFALSLNESNHLKEKGISQEKIKIIPNGIDSSIFLDLPEKGIFRQKNKIPVEKRIILYLGRIHKSKGLDILIDAFYDIIKTNNNTLLVLVGPDNNYFSELKQKIKNYDLEDKILYLGFIDKKEKDFVLIDADVFVTPSFFGFPISFLEAFAFGIPVVTTNKFDSLEWIDNKAGYVVNYNRDELKNAILNILIDPIIALNFSHNAKQIVHDCFTWEKIVEIIEREYNFIKNLKEK
jgi:glycosyltransferase involved in cell wall biosynthesis